MTEMEALVEVAGYVCTTIITVAALWMNCFVEDP